MSIHVDADFVTASAGEIRPEGGDVFTIEYRREEPPQWFVDFLDKHFDGSGVPKEYMSHVRVRNDTGTARTVVLNFILSPRGRGYMAPPWWQHTLDGWQPLPAEAFSVDDEQEVVTITLEVDAGEQTYVSSDVCYGPDYVEAECRRIAAAEEGWHVRELGRSEMGRPILGIETEPRPLKVLVASTMQGNEPAAPGILHAAESLQIPIASVHRLRRSVQFLFVPHTNPDAVAEGRSVTNARGSVPKFCFRMALENAPETPAETRVVWNALKEFQPTIYAEIHAHSYWGRRFLRAVGWSAEQTVPEALKTTHAAMSNALMKEYPLSMPGISRHGLIDYRKQEESVYGCEEFHSIGVVECWLQGVATSLSQMQEDVRSFVEVVARSLDTAQERGMT